jgi:RNA polymerase sigma-70 factor (ECF subfamily)
MNDPFSDINQRPQSNAAGEPDERSRSPLSPAESMFVQELFERHRFSLYGYLHRLLHSREEAKEILQETYWRLLRQPSFERVRENARAYLFRTATNLAQDHFRRKTSHSIDAEGEVFSASGLGIPHWESWPDLALEGEQTGQLILQALRDMPQPMRTALLLHRFRDLTHRQIAVWLGVSERTVERYIKEGLSLIAAKLEAGR